MKIKWTKLFNWSVVNVSRPYAASYDGMARYNVDVTYLHHGTEIVTFAVAGDRMWMCADRLAKRKAIEFYLIMRKRIK